MRLDYRRHWALVAILVLTMSPVIAVDDGPLDFDRDIRPILSENCFQCHGPDGAERKGGLRLDTQEGAFADLDGTFAIVAGKPTESSLIHRIDASDPDDQMPPPEAKKKFGEKERALLRRWISEGATWSEHWALIPPVKFVPPENTDDTWSRNPIDRFIAAKLGETRLAPAAEASRETLIRRLSLDLTGLPPTPAEVDAFLTDPSHNAYERLVDRLLSSHHYGERMAWPWLDAARYADTNGYQGDRERTMYPWRDWVVQAFNENMPYDQFTIEQLAGDLLPDATRDQRLATGFNRNHMINGEGGRIAEENRVEYVFDQLETTATIWMGMTFNCCRCHDHKYDPLTKADYYRFFAFFNQTPVTGSGGDPRTAPVLAIHTDENQARMDKLREDISTFDTSIKSRLDALKPEKVAWEKDALARIWENEKAWTGLSVREATATHQSLEVLEDGAVLASGDIPETEAYEIRGEIALPSIGAIRLDALRHLTRKDSKLVPSSTGNFVLTDFNVALRQADGTELPLNFASAEATFEQGSFSIEGTFDEDPNTGWAVYESGALDRDHVAIFRLKESVQIPPDSTFIARLNHASKHKQHILRHFRISASNVTDTPLVEAPHHVASILRTPPEHRSDEARAKLSAAHHESDEAVRGDKRAREQAKRTLQDVDRRGVRVMVMEDQAKPRKTFMLRTGLYNQLEDEVSADTPESLFELASDASRNRLGLARWLVDPRHPLTARVTVNRFWAEFFGTGLVKTTENFGVQGEKPSHPELLDWLAVDFVESGWDVKALLRLMVTSASYRQTSNSTAEKNTIDPANRLLSRAPRFRMPSWMIRDQALAAGGSLVAKLGGPPVKPYQPEGLWQEFSFGKIKYEPDAGAALYRRSLYTYWRRIVAPPMFFDASTRQTCSVKATRTNTPLHALATLNDPAYVEAARTMAGKLLTTPDVSDRERIDGAFRLCMARSAESEELDLLEQSLARLRQEFGADPESAEAYLSVGASKTLSGIDQADYAAYASLCLSIMNTDEALTKE
jgi:mono/diheme cytochrome c family protein